MVGLRRPATIHLRPVLPPAWWAYPRTRAGSSRTSAQVGPWTGPLGLAPGGVCRADRSPRPLVVSYTTVSPLPPEGGGLFSVALSRRSPRVAVGHHPAPWSPDFPQPRPERRCRGRPTDSPGPLYGAPTHCRRARCRHGWWRNVTHISETRGNVAECRGGWVMLSGSTGLGRTPRPRG